MLGAERRRRILEVLDRDGTVRVTTLADDLGVSEMTVRRDLEVLASDDVLHKVHGGAVVRGNRGEEPWSATKAGRERAEKAAIARVAVELVHDGMTIAISAGTTTAAIARRLRDRRALTVITNSVPIFGELTDPATASRHSGVDAYLTGGARTRSDALVGPLAEQALGAFRVDLTLLGVHGLDPDAGLTTPNIAEAAANQRMIDIAQQVAVVADHTKYREVGAHVIADLGRIDTLVTDDGLAAAHRTTLSRSIDDVRIATVARS